jgi:hypothetical protein
MTDDKKIDESWKEKAQAEKEPAAPPPRHDPPPPADFPSLVASIAAGAFMALGLAPSEEGQAGPPDLERARYAIDLLGMLAGKTKGNLAPAEERHLSAVLHQLRLAFVEASRAK